MQRALPATLLASAIVAISGGGAFAAGHVTAASQATHKPAAKKPAPVTTHRYVGPGVDMQWGTVQVTIIVKGSAVTGLTATAPTERARSAYINDIAVPMLRQEVLQAKTVANIKNIYAVSGATMTSDAFYQSLLAALHQAKLI